MSFSSIDAIWVRFAETGPGRDLQKNLSQKRLSATVASIRSPYNVDSASDTTLVCREALISAHGNKEYY